MSQSMSSIRLEIDGSLSHILESSTSPCPHIELPPFLASISSIHSDDTAQSLKARKQKAIHRSNLSKKRYNYLCGNIVVILILEFAILFGILAMLSCSFYSVSLEDVSGTSFTLNIGLFRYSMSKQSSQHKPKCLVYDANSLSFAPALQGLFETIMSMLKTSQGLAITAPLVATIVCVVFAFDVIRPQRFCARWQIVLSLFLAALIQFLVVISFDGKSVWYESVVFVNASFKCCSLTILWGSSNAIPDSRGRKCDYSTGSTVCFAAAIFYVTAMVLLFFLPVDDEKDSRTFDKETGDDVVSSPASAEKEQNQSEKDIICENAMDAWNSKRQGGGDLAECCDVGHQTEKAADKGDNEDDVEQMISFETLATEPTSSSPSRERQVSFSFDTSYVVEAIPVESPYDEASKTESESLDNNIQRELLNDAILNDLEKLEQESQGGKSSLHDDLVFDLM